MTPKFKNRQCNSRSSTQGEIQNVNLINVKGKIISIDEIETVGKHPYTEQKRDVMISDETGQIDIMFWRGRCSIRSKCVCQQIQSLCPANMQNEDIQVETVSAITKDKPNVVTFVQDYIGP